MTSLATSVVYLKPIDGQDIEEIRLIRNSYVGKNIFQFDYKITKEDQNKWYVKLDKEKCCFFIVKLIDNDSNIGYVHCSQKNKTDIKNNSAEIGIILKPNIENLTIPHQCIALLIHYCFIIKKINCIYGIFNKKNTKAIRLIKFFQFKKIDENQNFLTMSLELDCYNSKVVKINSKFLV